MNEGISSQSGTHSSASEPTREVELKARVDDLDSACDNVESAGAVLVFDGALHDRVFDTMDGSLTRRDEVLRLRTYTSRLGTSSHLDWKGPTTREGGFKIRSELTTGMSDPEALAAMLDRLGYVVVREIEREITQYELSGVAAEEVVVIRFERYPRMDTLVEVEGTPDGIERGIAATGIARAHFSADRLTDFMKAFQARTGVHAAINHAAPDAL